ncbi:MAG TPA: histidinol dehydrogenase, partial [Bacteroidia bacterium]|nr:histidinol dehydrogenase [Bacteroidia bacterium]
MKIKILKYPSEKELQSALKRPIINDQDLEKSVSEILNAVRKDGDKAVKKFALKFDAVNLKNTLASKEEIIKAIEVVSPELKKAMKVAYNNIYKFHEAQKEKVQKIETSPGVVCWRKSVGIERVGLYIPGGSAPLFSTV